MLVYQRVIPKSWTMIASKNAIGTTDFDAPKPHQCGLHGIGVAPGGVDETIHLGCWAFPVKSWQELAGCQGLENVLEVFWRQEKRRGYNRYFPIEDKTIAAPRVIYIYNYIYNYPVKKNLFKRQENCPSSMRGSAQTGPPKGTCKRKV